MKKTQHLYLLYFLLFFIFGMPQSVLAQCDCCPPDSVLPDENSQVIRTTKRNTKVLEYTTSDKNIINRNKDENTEEDATLKRKYPRDKSPYLYSEKYVLVGEGTEEYYANLRAAFTFEDGNTMTILSDEVGRLIDYKSLTPEQVIIEILY